MERFHRTGRALGKWRMVFYQPGMHGQREKLDRQQGRGYLFTAKNSPKIPSVDLPTDPILFICDITDQRTEKKDNAGTSYYIR